MRLCVALHVLHGCILLTFAFLLAILAVDSGVKLAHGRDQDGDPTSETDKLVQLRFLVSAPMAALSLLGVAATAETVRCLRARRKWHWCRSFALLALPFFPWGTFLGWSSLRVLNRPAVRQAFDVAG